MNYILYSITIILVLIWAIGVLAFNAASSIHLLLVFALLSVVATIFLDQSRSDDNNMRTL